MKGLSYVTELYNGKTIYLYMNYDSINCVLNALHVLKQVPSTLFSLEPEIVINEG